MKPTQRFIVCLCAGRIFIVLKLLPLFAFLVASPGLSDAQSIHPCPTCLPEGITIVRQSQIDSFHINYPQCTQILGAVKIDGAKIKKLNGLTGLITIGGDLEVKSTTLLENLTGFDSLISVGGTLHLNANQGLKNLNGLQSLTLVGGFLLVESNVKLTELNGLDNILNVGGHIAIYNNNSLPEIGSFNKMVSLRTLTISGNERLDRITGFANVNYAAGLIRIVSHATLRHLTGFGNLEFASGIEIFENTVLESLETFGNLNTIGYEGLKILGNQRLTAIPGFTMLAEIKGSLRFEENPELFNLTGLRNLHSVQGNINVSYNEMLTSLEAFESLEQMNGFLMIRSNRRLKSLTGIDNLYPGSIIGMIILDNDSLSHCAVSSVCKYLQYSGFGKAFNNNAPGCNSKTEVDSACAHMSTDGLAENHHLMLSPNPATRIVTITLQTHTDAGVVRFIDLPGHEVLKHPLAGFTTKIDLDGIPAGLYIVHATCSNKTLTGKLIVCH